MDRRDLENLRLPPLEEVLGEALGDFVEEEAPVSSRSVENEECPAWMDSIDEKGFYTGRSEKRTSGGDFNGALRDINRAIGIDPTNPYLHKRKVKIADLAGNRYEANTARDWVRKLALSEEHDHPESFPLDHLEVVVKRRIAVQRQAKQLLGDRRYYDAGGEETAAYRYDSGGSKEAAAYYAAGDKAAADKAARSKKLPKKKRGNFVLNVLRDLLE